MAFLNISILTDAGASGNAVFRLDDHSAKEIERTLASASGLIPFEALGNAIAKMREVRELQHVDMAVVQAELTPQPAEVAPPPETGGSQPIEDPAPAEGETAQQ